MSAMLLGAAQGTFRGIGNGISVRPMCVVIKILRFVTLTSTGLTGSHSCCPRACRTSPSGPGSMGCTWLSAYRVRDLHQVVRRPPAQVHLSADRGRTRGAQPLSRPCGSGHQGDAEGLIFLYLAARARVALALVPQSGHNSAHDTRSRGILRSLEPLGARGDRS